MTPFNRFTSSFHQNDHTVSIHFILVTDDLEIAGQGQNLQNGHLLREYFYKKNFPRKISLKVTVNQKCERVSELGVITANNHRRCFQKVCSGFSPFPGRVEN